MTVARAKDRLLVVFTKLPKPGFAKTRLIPALGPEGAADLQRRMTMHTVNRALRLRDDSGLALEVRYTGGDRADFESWLGRDLQYQSQSAGDLGERMSHAFASAIERGFRSVVIIGTDCPHLDRNIISQSFAVLETNDLVLGPAHDGGYYLIGLNRCPPELLQGIHWGTEYVLEQTLTKANQACLSWHLLETLNDIDRPEDLAHWEDCQKAELATDGSRISIIIPTLNEGDRIGDLLSDLAQVPGVELIVADGGSTDQTLATARRYGAMEVTSPPGRGQQMNAGANRASGDILVFLHADTQLPSNFPSLVRQGLEQPDIVAGAFRFRLDERSPMLAVVEWLTNLRCLVQSEPYGDQALFMHAAVFHEMGGYPDTPILEDVMLVRRLKRRGRITILKQYAVTSSRRWKRLGIMTTFLLHRMVMLAFALRVQPLTIARWLKRLNYYRATQPSTDLHRNEETRSCIQRQ